MNQSVEWRTDECPRCGHKPCRYRRGAHFDTDRMCPECQFTWCPDANERGLLQLAHDRRAEIECLRGIVNRLPTTADGVTVIPVRDAVWIIDKYGDIKQANIWGLYGDEWRVHPAHYVFPDRTYLICDCYSTRKAAEAAEERDE